MQEILGHFQERLAYSEKPMEDLSSEKEMIQTSLFSELKKEQPFRSLNLASLYKIRYVRPKTGVILKGSFYFQKEKKRRVCRKNFYRFLWKR